MLFKKNIIRNKPAFFLTRKKLKKIEKNFKKTIALLKNILYNIITVVKSGAKCSKVERK